MKNTSKYPIEKRMAFLAVILPPYLPGLPYYTFIILTTLQSIDYFILYYYVPISGDQTLVHAFVCTFKLISQCTQS